MRSYPESVAIETAKAEAAGFWLFELILAASAARYTDCDIPLYHEGNRFAPATLKIRDILHSASFSIDTVTVDLSAVDLGVAAMLLNEDAAGRTANLYYTLRGAVAAAGSGEEVDVEFADGDVAFEDGDAAFAGSATPARAFAEIGTVSVLRGLVLGWKLAEKTAQVRLANEKMLWRKRAMRIPTDSCPWVFRGERCRYAGPDSWCDQSRERCAALGNKLNFGGRRGILALETRKLWWGPAGTKNVT